MSVWQDINKHVADSFLGVSDNDFDKGINAWLETSMQLPQLHWFVMGFKGLLQGPQKFGGAGQATQVQVQVAAIMDRVILDLATVGINEIFQQYSYIPGMQEFLSTMAQVQQYMQDPNIEGIVVSSPKLTCSREIELSEHMVIVQKKDQSAYKTDNATPKPRQWQLEGYLRQTSQNDAIYLIKPSLALQTRTLDAYAVSRKPLWFKDDYNLFWKVQIKSFTYEHDATATNAVKIAASLQEYVPYIVHNEQANVLTMLEKKS